MAVYAADSTIALTDVASAAASALPSERIIKTGGDYQQKTVGEHQILEVTVKDENDNAVPNTQVVFQVAKGGGTLVGGLPGKPLTVTTDNDGKASVELILGTETADNPIGWVEAGLNTQQVGLNVVECWPAKIPSYKTIFSVYGIPDDPASIQLHNDIVDISTMEVPVLTWVHDVLVSVLDQHGNPISNVPVTVNTGDIIELSNEDCDKVNSDTRPALVLPIEERDTEFPFAYETFAGYADQPLIITSDYNPVPFTVFSGGIPDVRYYFDITTSSGLFAQQYTQTETRSESLGNCSGYDAPGSIQRLFLRGSGIHEQGEIVQFSLWIYELKEKDDIIAQCSTCEDIIGKTEYFTGSSLTNIALAFNDSPCVLSDNTPCVAVEVGCSNVSNCGHEFLATTEVPSSTGYINVSVDFIKETRNREYQDGSGCYCTLTDTETGNISDWLYFEPRSIVLDSSKIIPVDQNGQVLCDIEIPFEDNCFYYPQIISMTILEDGIPFAVLPIDPYELAPPVINRGTEFDLSKTYTAVIRADDWTDEGSLDGVQSNEMTLVLSEEDPIDYLYIENLKEKIPVMQGETVTIKAQTSPEELENDLEWSIVAEQPNDETEKIIAAIDPDTGVLTVDENSGSGTVTIRASYNGCVYKDAEVPIGCQECNEGYCPLSIEGSSSDRLSSVDFAISLGKTTDGNPAGSLLLRSDSVSAQLYSSEALYLSSLVRDNEVYYDANDALRQILTAKTFVDITTENEYRYTVSLYRPDDIAGQVDGLYTLNPVAVPFVAFQIENPDMLPTVSERLRITETRGSDSSVT
uniref:hypothetical protein n=1 Tax=Candidatus Electrothrix sp. TaxID=2170559 RepID=UPI00405775B0